MTDLDHASSGCAARSPEPALLRRRAPLGAARRMLTQFAPADCWRKAAKATWVNCDACDDGHVEDVVWIRNTETGCLLPFIPCPEVGGAPVDPERLRRWAVDLDLAAAPYATGVGACRPVCAACSWARLVAWSAAPGWAVSRLLLCLRRGPAGCPSAVGTLSAYRGRPGFGRAGPHAAADQRCLAREKSDGL